MWSAPSTSARAPRSQKQLKIWWRRRGRGPSRAGRRTATPTTRAGRRHFYCRATRRRGPCRRRHIRRRPSRSGRRRSGARRRGPCLLMWFCWARRRCRPFPARRTMTGRRLYNRRRAGRRSASPPVQRLQWPRLRQIPRPSTSWSRPSRAPSASCARKRRPYCGRQRSKGRRRRRRRPYGRRGRTGPPPPEARGARGARPSAARPRAR